MEDAARRIVDCVIVWKYDRLARSLSVLVSALQQFHSLGVDFISYTQNIDTTTPMGRLFFHIIGSFAEFEREMIVERVRAGLANAKANAKAKGKVLGRPERDYSARRHPHVAGAGSQLARNRQTGKAFACRRVEDTSTCRS